MLDQSVDRSNRRPAWVSVWSVCRFSVQSAIPCVRRYDCRSAGAIVPHSNHSSSRTVPVCQLSDRSVCLAVGLIHPSVDTRFVRSDGSSACHAFDRYVFPLVVGLVGPWSGLTVRRLVLRLIERYIDVCLGSAGRPIDRSVIRPVGRFCWSAVAPEVS